MSNNSADSVIFTIDSILGPASSRPVYASSADIQSLDSAFASLLDDILTCLNRTVFICSSLLLRKSNRSLDTLVWIPCYSSEYFMLVLPRYRICFLLRDTLAAALCIPRNSL